jgi:hypothetical protein
MATHSCKDARDDSTIAGNAVYHERHRPEQTLLYLIVGNTARLFGRSVPVVSLKQSSLRDGCASVPYDRYFVD